MVGESVATCPKDVFLPIIFIPGIMGSRLRNRASGEIVWEPGLGSWDQAWNAFGLARRGLQGKRRQLVGPPDAYFENDFLEVAHIPDGGIEDDGDGGLLATYLPFMRWLRFPERWMDVDGCRVQVNFRVWAFPYNWTASNLTSASEPVNAQHGNLEAVINRAVADCERMAEATYKDVLKPVIVTHSMGGLVSRAFTEVLGKGSMVHGVIHGAMPTHGSVELYKRMRSGFEGGTALILGRNAGQVTSTAGNCPGPLELAPNGVHQGVNGEYKWLGATDPSGQMQQLPNGDPYSEIYLNQSDYYRLLLKEVINSEGDPTGDVAFVNAAAQVRRAQAYHNAVGRNGFHPNTRMFYGTGIRTRDRVDWRLLALHGAPPADGTFDDAQVVDGGASTGVLTLTGAPNTPRYAATIHVSDVNAPGDETVQAGSGIHAGQMAVEVGDGFSHQAAFDSREARGLTEQWLLEMAEEQVRAA